MVSHEPFTFHFESPIGWLEGKILDTQLLELRFVEATPKVVEPRDYALKVVSQLTEYFAGERKEFDLNLKLEGTPFQEQVWDAVCEVEYGATKSYLEIAKVLGDKNAVRAVGTSNGKNPILLIIPCHRIIGANRSMTGYAGGLERKKHLLKLELEHTIRKGELF